MRIRRASLYFALIAFFALASMPAAALITVGSLNYGDESYDIELRPRYWISVNPMSIDGIEVVDGLTYAAGVEGLKVIDVSDPSAPIEVGSIDLDGKSFPNNVRVRDKIAYVVNVAGLWVIDVSSPASPALMGALVFTEGDPSSAIGKASLEIVGSVVYAQDASRGQILIIDVSNPEAPVEIGAIESHGNLKLLEIADGLAYVHDSEAGVLIYDVSDPTTPVQVGVLDSTRWASDLEVIGRLAYLVTERDLHVIDIADPLAPIELSVTDLRTHYPIDSKYPSFFSATDLEVIDGTAYIMDYDESQLRVVDVRDPAAPVVRGTTGIPGHSFDFEVAHGFAFVADREAGLQVIDVSHPDTPSIIGGIGQKVGVFAMEHQIAYLLGSDFRIYDVSNPADPVLLASFENTLPASCALEVVDGLAYGIGYRGLWILDVSNPLNPTQLSSIDTRWQLEAWTPDIQVVNGILYTIYNAPAGMGLLMIDVSDPRNPREVGSYEINLTGFHVANDIAYIATGDGLAVLDVSDPAYPSEIGYLDTRSRVRNYPGDGYSDSYALDVTVVDQIAYLAQYRQGVLMVDVSDPAEPELVGSYKLSESGNSWANKPYRIDYADGILFVDTGIERYLFELSDPLGPRFLGRLEKIHTLASREPVYFDDGLVYAAGELGFVSIDLGSEYRFGTAASDAFQCYGAHASNPASRLGAAQLHLSDTFGDRVDRAGRVREFCAPVDVDGLGIAVQDASLSCYDLLGPGFGGPLRGRQRGLPLGPSWQTFDVVVDNEFGAAQALTVQAPEQLCVASKLGRSDARVAPAAPAGPLLDHLQCYGVEPSDGLPSFDPFEISLSDFVGDATGRVGDPTRLCAPVDIDGQGVVHSDAHLVCYEVEHLDRRLGREGTRLLVSNFLREEQQMTVRGAKTVCVPSDVRIP